MKKKAFTLVELLVVISIIALLLAILMPSLQKARMSAREVVCSSTLHQLGVAMLAYEMTNGRLPLHYVERPGSTSFGTGWPDQLSSNLTNIDRRELWLKCLPDLNFLNCAVLKPLDISISGIPLDSRRVYCGYSLVAGYWRNRDVNGKWSSESGRWTKTFQKWSYMGKRIDVLACDRLYRSLPTSYYRVNHGSRIGFPQNYIDYENSRDIGYCVSVYETYGATNMVNNDLRKKTNAAYLFKDGSAKKYFGNDNSLVDVFEPTDQSGRSGSQLMPAK